MGRFVISRLVKRFAMLVLLLASGVAYANPSKEVDLSLWGLSDPSQIGYVSIGVLHKKEGDQLIVYDIRKQKPQIVEATAKSAAPKIDNGVFLISHFNQSNVNMLGGYFNVFSKSPSTGMASIGAAPDGSRALKFSYALIPPGYAGFWIGLNNFKLPPRERVFLDASPFAFLTFFIRGNVGGEGVALHAADRTWAKREDSLPVGDIGAFLPAGKVMAEWQQAWVPLEKFPQNIDRKELANIVFKIAGNGSGKIYIKDMALTTKKDVILPALAAGSQTSRALGKGMWLWETDKITGSPAEMEKLKNFCVSQGITDLFVQIPYEAKQDGNAWSIAWNSSKVKPLIALLHRTGIRIHALDGDPKYALTKYHGRIIALIKEIIRYNETASANEHFDGVRYDNEPYLLPGFGGVQRESILKQYLDLLGQLKSLTASAKLELGVDIPFWFDERNEYFEPTAVVSGRPMSELIIDIADNIGIMDYRTTAYGANGVIEQAISEIRYAAKQGKKIFVGLETVSLPDETLADFTSGGSGQTLSIDKLEGNRVLISYGEGKGRVLRQIRSIDVPASKLTFAGKKARDLKDVMQEVESEFIQYPSFYGFAIHSYESYRPWLERTK
ncbi:MAG: hypothetical protein V2A66_06570 [Pseudomonadota bacterium]